MSGESRLNGVSLRRLIPCALAKSNQIKTIAAFLFLLLHSLAPLKNIPFREPACEMALVLLQIMTFFSKR